MGPFLGPLFSFLERGINLVFNEDQLPATVKRWKLARLRRQADEALAQRDMSKHAQLVSELERLSDKP
jgi:uncharacterized protein YpiB (UPF0302 family)